MLKSMTGFGTAKVKLNHSTIHVEIRSLNSKFLDISLKSFPLTNLQELWIRNEFNMRIQRGKVSLNLSLEQKEGEKRGTTVSLDLEVLQFYIQSLLPLAQNLNQDLNRLLSDCLNLPGVVKNSEEVQEEESWIEIQKALLVAIEGLNQFRKREGKIIQLELEERVGIILKFLKKVENSGPDRIQLIKTRLENTLLDLKSGLEFDPNRFEQELIYYIDKIDFSEEISRLNSHSQYFINCLQEEKSNGKKLGFIVQEMGREINTLGAKAGDAQIQQYVVQMKEELEKIKEQIANIL